MARILVVEDESILAKHIQGLLLRLGHVVPAIATTADEAVLRAEDSDPDLVLMDIVLRGPSDGVSAARTIRERFNLPIVYLTAYADDATLERAKVASPFGYLLKPFEESDLRTTVQLALFKHAVEERIRRSEHWLATTLQSIGDAVIVADRSGRVTQMNPVAEALTGWSQAEAQGQDVAVVFRLEGVPADEHPVAQALREGKAVALPDGVRLQGRGGRRPLVGDSAAPIMDEQGQARGVVLVFRDVGEQLQAEEALRASEERYRSLYHDTPSMYFTVDAEGTVLSVNQFGAEQLGYTPEELTGRPLSLVFVEEDREPAAAHMAQCVAHPGRLFHWELRRVRKDGSRLWVKESARAVRDGAGRTVVLIVCEDISARRRAERALQEAEKKYREIFENAVEGIFQTTPSGRFLTANPAMARMLGYSSPEELTAHATDIGGQLYVLPERRLDFRAALDERGSIQGFISQLYRRDGGSIWTSVSARAVRGEDGEVLYYEGTAEDITERRRAEEAEGGLRAALNNAAVEWARTFDSMEAPILILEKDGRIVRLNRAALELAGRSTYGELLGRAASEVSLEEPWQQARRIAARVGEARTTLHAQVRDAVTLRTWDLTADPLAEAAGQDERVIVVARDITRLVELQDSLRRNETMSALGLLLAGVAHEVRNPLFSISANLDAFEAQFGTRSEFGEVIQLMRQEVERLATLMRELLEYGRPPEAAAARGTIDTVMADALRWCAGLSSRSGVTLVSEVGPGFPPLLMDRKRLVQVFQNLLQNAIQHSPPGGTVRIGAQREEGAGGEFVVLTISDSGPGFIPEDLPRLFEPFFTRRREGTGLGLAIVQRIVEEHGGTVSAANQPQGGATMTVRLPCSLRRGGP